MADPNPSQTLATTEAILFDGANGVTTAPRQHFPGATPVLVLALLVAVLVRFVKRAWLVPALLLAAAIPGAVHVLLLRADAPLQNRRTEEEQSGKRVERSRADVVALASMTMGTRRRKPRER